MARPKVHDDALRIRLLEVTSRVISSGGEQAVTVRAVARDAGTSASAVYDLFGSREALVRAVGDEGFRRFAEHLAVVGQTEDPGDDLRRLGLAYRTSALDDPHFYRVMFERSVSTAIDLPAGERTTFHVLRDAVARVMAGAPDAAVDRAAEGLWALAHGLVSLELGGHLPGNARSRAETYEATLVAAGGALLAPPEEAEEAMR